jgi:hypothetical protein
MAGWTDWGLPRAQTLSLQECVVPFASKQMQVWRKSSVLAPANCAFLQLDFQEPVPHLSRRAQKMAQVPIPGSARMVLNFILLGLTKAQFPGSWGETVT